MAKRGAAAAPEVSVEFAEGRALRADLRAWRREHLTRGYAGTLAHVEKTRGLP